MIIRINPRILSVQGKIYEIIYNSGNPGKEFYLTALIQYSDNQNIFN